MPSTSEMPAWWPHPPLDHAAFTERLHRSVNGHSSGGFAVAYTDKGTGIGAHDLDRNTVQLINGECASADALGQAAHFSAKLSTEERAAYARDWPHHFAFKHAHSERNPEQYWGEDVLRAIRFALHVLNLHLGGTPGRPAITRSSTLVIASGISNGGAAPLRAAEQDWQHLIDGVVVSEPAVQPIEDGSGVGKTGSSRHPRHISGGDRSESHSHPAFPASSPRDARPQARLRYASTNCCPSVVTRTW